MTNLAFSSRSFATTNTVGLFVVAGQPQNSPVMSAALRKTGLLDVYVPDGEAEKKAPCRRPFRNCKLNFYCLTSCSFRQVVSEIFAVPDSCCRVISCSCPCQQGFHIRKERCSGWRARCAVSSASRCHGQGAMCSIQTETLWPLESAPGFRQEPMPCFGAWTGNPSKPAAVARRAQWQGLMPGTLL